MFQLLAKYPVSVFPFSWTIVSVWPVKPGFTSSFPLPPSTTAGESDLMDKFCRRSPCWSIHPFYQSDVTEAKAHFFNTLRVSRGRRGGASTANGRIHCLPAKASSGQFLITQLFTESHCVLDLRWLKQRNLLPLQQTHSVTPGNSFNCMCPNSSFPQDSNPEIHEDLCWFMGFENKPTITKCHMTQHGIFNWLHEGLGGSVMYAYILFSCSQRTLLLPFLLNMHIRVNKILSRQLWQYWEYQYVKQNQLLYSLKHL